MKLYVISINETEYQWEGRPIKAFETIEEVSEFTNTTVEELNKWLEVWKGSHIFGEYEVSIVDFEPKVIRYLVNNNGTLEPLK